MFLSKIELRIIMLNDILITMIISMVISITIFVQPWQCECSLKLICLFSIIYRLLMLVNKKPKWDAAQKGHVLNFEVSLIVNRMCAM